MPYTPPVAAGFSTFDAVSPAIERTRALLFREFRFRRFLKLTFAACLSMASGIQAIYGLLECLAMSVAMIVLTAIFGSHGEASESRWIAVMCAAAILLLGGIGLGLVYLGIRLRLALTGMVATTDTEVGPAFREFGLRTWNYLGVLLVAALFLLIPIAALIVPAILHFCHSIKELLPFFAMPHGSQMPPEFIPTFLSLEMSLYAAIFLVMILLRIAEGMTRDLMMIPMAVEDATGSESFGFLHGLFRVERGRTLGHILFHALLEFAGYMVGAFVAYIPTLIVALIALLIGRGMGRGLWNDNSRVLVIAYAITAGLFVLAIFLTLAIGAIGTAAIFVESHALEYLGPRYAPLHALMHPAIPAPAPQQNLATMPSPPPEPPPAGTF